MALSSASPVSVPVQLVRISLISALIACILAGWVLLVELFVPSWDGGYLIFLGVIATFETLYAEPRLRIVEFSFESRLKVRLAEFGLLLLLTKLLSYWSLGWGALIRAAAGWFANPISFITPEFFFGGMLLGIVLLAAFDVAHGLQALDDYLEPRNQVEGLAAVKSNFVIGAYALLAAVGLRHVFLVLFGMEMPAWQASLQMILPLVYIGLGLVLLGQARFSLLRAGWEHDGVPVDPRLGGRWAGWGLLFVLAVSALALFMPAGDTIAGFYVLTWLGHLANLIAGVILAIIMTVLAIILAPCAFLFQQQAPVEQRGPAPTPVPLAQPVTAPDWMLQVQSLLFVVIAVALVWFLIRIYASDRASQFRNNPLGRLWLLARAVWQSLWKWGKQVRIHLPSRGASRKSKPVVAGVSLWDRWRARTARERVRRLYLVLLQRAAQSGYPRRPEQTPSEYVAQLEPQLPAEREALEKLTEAFVEARYSRRDFQAEEVGLLHRLWERLQSTLRQMRK